MIKTFPFRFDILLLFFSHFIEISSIDHRRRKSKAEGYVDTQSDYDHSSFTFVVVSLYIFLCDGEISILIDNKWIELCNMNVFVCVCMCLCVYLISHKLSKMNWGIFLAERIILFPFSTDGISIDVCGSYGGWWFVQHHHHHHAAYKMGNLC